MKIKAVVIVCLIGIILAGICLTGCEDVENAVDEVKDKIDDMSEEESDAANPDSVAWGDRVSMEFRGKILEISDILDIEADHLMAVIAFETASTFDPAITNPTSGATGLIQFMPTTAVSLGTTTDALKQMSAVEQLHYVEEYLKPYIGRLDTLEDLYMAILWPAAIGKSNSSVIFESPSIYYTQNSGLDGNNDGKVTKEEASERVRAKLVAEQQQTSFESVTLTLYVHNGGSSGPVVAQVQVTGQDAAGNSFNKTTDSSGYVIITGVPGTWQFGISKSGFESNTWAQSITTTDTKHAFFMGYESAQSITLTLYVHDGSAGGPTVAEAQITGQDASGNAFSQITNSDGYATITGVPGTWQLSISKSGFQTNSWTQSITASGIKHAFFVQ